MNKELLEKVAVQIETHPEQLDMLEWDCGTTACIAGHAARIAGLEVTWLTHGTHGRPYLPGINRVCHLLGIEQVVATEGQGIKHALLLVDNWPEVFELEYKLSDTDEERAKATAARIRHFIATDGKE